MALMPLSPANAVVVKGTDPSGDATSPTHDITTVDIDYTGDMVTVVVTVQGTLPPFSDPSWEQANTEGRAMTVVFDANLSGLSTSYFYISGEGVVASDLRGDATACIPTATVTGNTVTVVAPASCVAEPGTLGVNIAMGDFSSNTPAEIDYAPDGTDQYAATVPGGYWLLAGDGGVFSFGDAQFYGSTGGLVLNAPVVGMSAMPSGNGYRFVASDGGVFNYGSAVFYGSRGGQPLNKPVVGMTSTPTGIGYWLVASDGGIFSYGDAVFHGSTGSMTLNRPIVAMASTPTGNGYWLLASDGGIFTFGDAQFFGSTGSVALSSPVVDMAVTTSGAGYWLTTAAGEVYAYGDAPLQAAAPEHHVGPVVAIEAAETASYRKVSADGSVVDHGGVVRFQDISDLNITLNAPIVDMVTAN